MTDWYLEDRTRLQGQPKITLGDYVERNGILVPKRTRDYGQALSFTKPMARSEHEQDYDGIPNLFHSPLVDGSAPDYATFREEAVSSVENRIHNYNVCDHVRKLLAEVSYSFWEVVDGGQNYMVIADNAINGRYHFILRETKENYLTVIENGEIVFSDNESKSLTPSEFAKMIKFYEEVRNLDRFDPNHCPIVECQFVDPDVYFLQYFRSNDFQEADFVLDRPLEENEIKAQFVRGITPEEGLELKATFVHDAGDYQRENGKPKITLWGNGFRETLSCICEAHAKATRLFMAPLFVGMDSSELYTPKEISKLFDKAHGLPAPDMEFAQVRLTSDGRTAFVKRLN